MNFRRSETVGFPNSSDFRHFYVMSNIQTLLLGFQTPNMSENLNTGRQVWVSGTLSSSRFQTPKVQRMSEIQTSLDFRQFSFFLFPDS